MLLFLLIVPALALTPAEIALFKPRNASHVEINTGLKSVVNITDNGDGSLTVYSNGIPSHDTWEFPTTNNPNDLKELIVAYKINKTPVMRQEPLKCLPHGNIAIATTGVAIDGWFASEKGCPYAADFEELDICEGHPTPDGQYHYHHYSPCVQMPVCGKPSPIYAVAIDGIPIYGPFDEDGRQLTNQDLDECGGKVDKSGRYKYHLTMDPPYSISCLKGELRNDLGVDPKLFFCSCPYDDSMMRDSSKGRPPKPVNGTGNSTGGTGHAGFDTSDKPTTPSMCTFDLTAGGTPAKCEVKYNTSTVMTRKWVQKEKTITLAGCCPEGLDCGLSCKKAPNSTEKSKCTYETRTVMVTTNVAASGKPLVAPFSLLASITLLVLTLLQ